ncbi:MAG TPA: C40 family peptidase, partial [Micromonosporaceae bacterium]
VKRASILGQIAQLKSLRVAAYGAAGTPPDPVINFIPVFTADAAGKAVRFAYDQLGKAYRFGASGPNQYDCSGLTMSAWKSVGVNLPHSAAEQYRVIKHVTRAQLRPGDLVFYFHPIHHVGIYVGADKVINAPTYGEPVKISPLTLAPIAGYGRP